MKRIILFSTLTEANSQTILGQLFDVNSEHKTLAYMPSDGLVGAAQYIDEWQAYARKFKAKFTVIDNHSSSIAEKQKLLSANILVISGGNTFALLHNLRTSGLDRTIVEFDKKPDCIVAGFSAGAIVLTPTITVCSLPNFDENKVGITDFTGLGLVDFEVFPHYNSTAHKNTLEGYRATTNRLVKQIDNDGYIMIDT